MNARKNRHLLHRAIPLAVLAIVGVAVCLAFSGSGTAGGTDPHWIHWLKDKLVDRAYGEDKTDLSIKNPERSSLLFEAKLFAGELHGLAERCRDGGDEGAFADRALAGIAARTRRLPVGPGWKQALLVSFSPELQDWAEKKTHVVLAVFSRKRFGSRAEPSCVLPGRGDGGPPRIFLLHPGCALPPEPGEGLSAWPSAICYLPDAKRGMGIWWGVREQGDGRMEGVLEDGTVFELRAPRPGEGIAEETPGSDPAGTPADPEFAAAREEANRSVAACAEEIRKLAEEAVGEGNEAGFPARLERLFAERTLRAPDGPYEDGFHVLPSPDPADWLSSELRTNLVVIALADGVMDESTVERRPAPGTILYSTEANLFGDWGDELASRPSFICFSGTPTRKRGEWWKRPSRNSFDPEEGGKTVSVRHVRSKVQASVPPPPEPGERHAPVEDIPVPEQGSGKDLAIPPRGDRRRSRW